ncbi:uncharacterized protein LOC111412173 [Olea europaea subsp. europaea]|uniref:Uncharacterized protein LOC111412173 n=2 Tax=Olea europaea subsp. europaea TaxID=158383 RepID=A0A8S0SWL7_OLEEU|nr:uncharacterized protein LOC111412173 [Olea europaea subsp. europaea]
MTALSNSRDFAISPILSSSRSFGSINLVNFQFSHCKLRNSNKASFCCPSIRLPITVTMAAMASDQSAVKTVDSVPNSSMKLLFVEMGVGYDQHGQDITSAAMRACRDAISSNSIPAFRRGSIPGVSFDEMKLQIKLGVPRPLQHLLDIEKVKSVFPYGAISNVEVVDGGLICSSGVHVEEMGDKNDDCYIVNAAVYVGY